MAAPKSRAAPAITIVVLLVAMAVVAPLLAKYHGHPQAWIAQIQTMTAKKPSAPSMYLRHAVWVNRRSGLYYCRNSKFYGRIRPGEAMQQGSALQKGFRPAQGQTCP